MFMTNSNLVILIKIEKPKMSNFTQTDKYSCMYNVSRNTPVLGTRGK